MIYVAHLSTSRILAWEIIGLELGEWIEIWLIREVGIRRLFPRMATVIVRKSSGQLRLIRQYREIVGGALHNCMYVLPCGQDCRWAHGTVKELAGCGCSGGMAPRFSRCGDSRWAVVGRTGKVQSCSLLPAPIPQRPIDATIPGQQH